MNRRILSWPWLARVALSLLTGVAAAAQEAAPLTPVVADGETVADLAAVAADDVPELFSGALSAYEEGDYAAAVDGFARLVALQPGNGAVLYNLGNSQLRNGELGAAIASYRSARDLLPRDRDLLANLQFARSTTRDALAAPEAGPLLRTLFFWHHLFSMGERLMLAVLLGLVFWCSLAVRLLRGRRPELHALVAISAAGLVALLTSCIWTWQVATDIAVVVPQEIDAQTAPREDGVVRFKVHAGTELRVVEERADWLRIELPDGERGWVDRQSILRAP